MQEKGKGFYGVLRASYKYGGNMYVSLSLFFLSLFLSLLPPLKEHSVITETAHPPACRPLRTETEGNVGAGRKPRAQRHRNVGCRVPVLH